VRCPTSWSKVAFQGAKHIKPDELQTITGIRPGMRLNPNLNRHGCQRIIDKYVEMGRPFSDCQLIKGGDQADTEVIYQITEGRKVTVRDIQFRGNSFVSADRLMTQLQSSSNWFHQPGSRYHKQLAESEIGELYKCYRSFGYLDALISLETQRSADGREVKLLFHIQEGKRYRLQDMPVIYVKDIPREQLNALSILKPGDYFEQPKISAGARAIAEYIKSIRQGAVDVRVDPIPVWLPDRPEICNVRYQVIEQPSRE
jgi:outer membrane protein assembly factor BamA